MNYHNLFIERYNFLENHFECISVLKAIYACFPNDEIIMKAINDLPAELIQIKGDAHITIRYNENTIYGIKTDVRYGPYGAMYKMAIQQALNNDQFGEISMKEYFKLLKNIDELESIANKPKPELVSLEVKVSKDSIIFEIITTKDSENK